MVLGGYPFSGGTRGPLGFVSLGKIKAAEGPLDRALHRDFADGGADRVAGVFALGKRRSVFLVFSFGFLGFTERWITCKRKTSWVFLASGCEGGKAKK